MAERPAYNEVGKILKLNCELISKAQAWLQHSEQASEKVRKADATHKTIVVGSTEDVPYGSASYIQILYEPAYSDIRPAGCTRFWQTSAEILVPQRWHVIHVFTWDGSITKEVLTLGENACPQIMTQTLSFFETEVPHNLSPQPAKLNDLTRFNNILADPQCHSVILGPQEREFV